MGKLKRANGEGTISKRKNKSGRVTYRAAVTVGVKPDGSPERLWVSGKTQDEAREKMQQIQSDLRRGVLAKTGGLSVSAHLDQWLDHKRLRLKPKTIEDYGRVVEKRLKPALGRLPLDKVGVRDIERLIDGLCVSVSPAEAKRTRTVLGLALGHAVKRQVLTRNPVDLVEVPKVEKAEMRVWQPGEVRRFLDRSQLHRLFALFHLALTTGMRCGELQGLRWQDVDLEKGILQVRQTVSEVAGQLSFGTPKSRASRRTIHLSPSTVDLLRTHRERQGRERAELREAWANTGLIFASEVGTALGHSNIRRLFLTLIEQAEVPLIRIHDMRHTAATAMIRRNYAPKLVADILGHADPAFTMREYAHVWEEHRREFAPSAADLYGASSPASLPN